MLKELYKRKDHDFYMRGKLIGLRQSKDIGNYINDLRIILNQISEISEITPGFAIQNHYDRQLNTLKIIIGLILPIIQEMLIY